MRIISHRGNLTGPDPERENTIEAIEKALSLGFDVEIDVWYLAGSFWLGHDKPERKFDINKLFDWSNKGNIYLHCKDQWSLLMFLKDKANTIANVFPFMHDKDPCILLRDDIVWVHPEYVHGFQSIPENCIAVLPKCKNIVNIAEDLVLTKFFGICTDYPENLRNSI